MTTFTFACRAFFTGLVSYALNFASILAQDLSVYKGPDFQDQQIDMTIGDEFIIDPPIPTISFIRHSDSSALLIEALNPVQNDVENWNGVYTKMFYYSEEWKRSGITGTDQYKSIPVRVKCIRQKLPEPEIYIPIDAGNVHSESTPFPYPAGDKSMLYLKRAFLWENSEDLLCNLDVDIDDQSPHGPTGDVKINVCHKSAANFSLDSLNKFQHLWDISNQGGCDVRLIYPPLLGPGVQVITDCNSRLIQYKKEDFISFFDLDYNQGFDTIIHLPQTLIHANTLFGPDYISPPACDANIAGYDAYAPVPHNEWTDGPWGTYYSDVAVVDWELISDDSIALVISEADVPFDYGVASSNNLADVIGVIKIKKPSPGDTPSEILFKVGMCGWVILNNEVSKRISAEALKYYWYPTWDGKYPELVLGPPAPIKHFENDQFFSDEIRDKCAPAYLEIIGYSTIKRVYINPEQRDTFRVYTFENVATDTVYSDMAVMDTLFWIKFKNEMGHQIKDTIMTTPADLYRRWGSQYQPYYSYGQLERYLLDNNKIGVCGGIIPPDNYLQKEMTLLPLDSLLGSHKKVLTPSTNMATPQKLRARNGGQIHGYIQVSPNPTNSFIHWSDQFGKNAAVLNANGKTLILCHGANQIDLSPLPAGIYFLRLQDDKGEIHFAKVVKE